MKTRNTLILFGVAVALFAFIFFYERKIPSTKEAKEREAHVVQFDREKIDGITITNNEDKIELRKRDNAWYVEKPVKDRADAAAVATLLTGVETLRKDAVIGEENGKKADLKDYGLTKSTLRLKLSGSGAPPELLFGKDAAVEGKTYVRVDDSDTAFLVENDLKNQLTKKADDFRDHRLTNLTAGQISKFTIKTPAGGMELEKKTDHWQINKPLVARADDSKVADTIAQVLTTQIDTFVPESGAAAAGLNEPRGTITLSAEGEKKPAVLQIGQPSEKDKDKVYAKLSTRESTYLLPKKVADLLSLKPNDLRDRHLLRVNFDSVDRITIEPAGRPKVVLARNGEDWIIKSGADRPANGAEIQRMIVDLQSTQVTAFVSDVASDLQKYGLDQASLKVTLSAYASENTAESKAGENPIETILFGKTEGDNVYARLDDEPFVVSVKKALEERIFADPVQWQDVSIFKLKPDDITSLEVAKGSQPPISLSRADKTWKASQADAKVNQTNVQSLLNTLAALRAARWAGSADQTGGAKMDLTITFKTTDNATCKLTVGAATPDGMWLATASDVQGTFVLPRPGVEALQLPLIEAPPAGANPDTVTPEPAASPAP